MGSVFNTRLRKVTSKDADKIEIYPNTLSYKIEIKNITQDNDGVWCMWFIPSDDVEDDQVLSGSLD